MALSSPPGQDQYFMGTRCADQISVVCLIACPIEGSAIYFVNPPSSAPSKVRSEVVEQEKWRGNPPRPDLVIWSLENAILSGMYGEGSANPEVWSRVHRMADYMSNYSSWAGDQAPSIIYRETSPQHWDTASGGIRKATLNPCRADELERGECMDGTWDGGWTGSPASKGCQLHSARRDTPAGVSAERELLRPLSQLVEPPLYYLPVFDTARSQGDVHSHWCGRYPEPAPGEDCTHWCQPGVVDWWAAMLLNLLLNNPQI